MFSWDNITCPFIVVSQICSSFVEYRILLLFLDWPWYRTVKCDTREHRGEVEQPTGDGGEGRRGGNQLQDETHQDIARK